MRERENESHLLAGSLPECPQLPGVGHAKVKSMELNPGLCHGWQGSNYLDHDLLPPRVSISRKLKSQWSQGSAL